MIRLVIVVLLLAMPALATESIGTATMERDGTIVLNLVATGHGGIRGSGVLRYPPGSQNRDMILQHLGGLAPGQTKPVPPFADPAPPR